jgi:hypothetical protein
MIELLTNQRRQGMAKGLTGMAITIMMDVLDLQNLATRSKF